MPYGVSTKERAEELARELALREPEYRFEVAPYEMESHYAYSVRTKPVVPCNANHLTFGNRCMNCGFESNSVNKHIRVLKWGVQRWQKNYAPPDMPERLLGFAWFDKRW